MNSLRLIREDLKNHLVEVTLPGENQKRSLFLVEVTTKTSMVEDIQIVYPEANSTQIKTAQKIFGTEKADNVYGVFLDPEKLNYTFSFNRAFAEYDRKSKTVIYRDLDDFLLERLRPVAQPRQKSDQKDIVDAINRSGRKRSTFTTGRRSHSTLIRYAATEKEGESDEQP